MKMIFSVTVVILQALMQHLNKNKILMPELKRCRPVITAWFSEWFNSEFVFDFFFFVFVCSNNISTRACACIGDMRKSSVEL